MYTNNHKQHTVSLFVSNKPGVLIRVSLVFARRGYNLESLVVSPAHDPAFSRMSLVASGDEKTLKQIIKQLNKLVDVIHATDHTGRQTVQHEMALVKVNCPVEKRTEILQVVEHFKGRTVDITESTVMLQVTGSSEKLDALHSMLDKFGVLESVRSGKLVMARGSAAT
jgi:acetolactate synthase-1/3 small subunit